MYSKVTLGGHPVHPMLIGYPVAGYTGTLVGFAVYAANGQQFWLNFAIVMNIAGVGGALLAALPGFADWLLGIPRSSAAKTVGLAHAGLNVVALALFAISLGFYAGHWNGPPRGAALGLGLAAAGVVCTIGAGFLGWMLVQTYHIGVELTPEQQRDELAVQNAPAPLHIHHNRAA
ncbi:DUF2231 domain-containing protein [Streptacidiphilus carbonis]|jgi:uncharacterized membrane protein|uniref:DUF2231 domain-containing protein n=1 Tax=Streptacidiphilus carbonis TaxID=105422 RepID=UPI0006932541|nr:DUF2231 domain-containing protein [Streptacidiphilus carbonis]